MLNTRSLSWYVDICNQKCFSGPIVCSVQLFGWDLKSLWQTANQKRCHALLRTGRLEETHKAYRCLVDTSDEAMMTNCRDWYNGKSSVI
jgi:hypothetical protein